MTPVLAELAPAPAAPAPAAPPRAVQPEAPPGPPALVRGADRVEVEVDRRGADLALDDGAIVHVEGGSAPVRVSFARTAARKGRRHLSPTYTIEASAVARLTVDVPYVRPASWARPCHATPYPALRAEGERVRDGVVVPTSWQVSENGSPARIPLAPGHGSLPAPFHGSFALVDTFPCP